MKSKRALVTGASSGIGEEFARQLAAQGYNVVAVARRESRLQELVAELPGDGHSYVCADLASDSGIQAVMDAIAAQRLNLLINNAGFSILEPFSATTLEQQQKILDVNCRAVVSLAHAFLAQSDRGDALINVSSVVAYLPTPAQPMYSASKAFLSAFSECLWEEHRERGVYVMGFCPGLTKTEFISTATGGEADGETMPEFMMQTSAECVGEAMIALRKRKKAIIVPGTVNRLSLLMPRMMTRHRLIKMLAVMGDPERQLK